MLGREQKNNHARKSKQAAQGFGQKRMLQLMRASTMPSCQDPAASDFRSPSLTSLLAAQNQREHAGRRLVRQNAIVGPNDADARLTVRPQRTKAQRPRCR